MSDPVSYTAVLPVGEDTVLSVSRLLATERARRGTRRGRRSLGCYRQAVLILRWFLDGTRLAPLATGNQIAGSTAYRYCPRASTCWPPPRRVVTVQLTAGIQTSPLVSSVRTSKGRRPCLAAVAR